MAFKCRHISISIDLFIIFINYYFYLFIVLFYLFVFMIILFCLFNLLLNTYFWINQIQKATI